MKITKYSELVEFANLLKMANIVLPENLKLALSSKEQKEILSEIKGNKSTEFVEIDKINTQFISFNVITEKIK